jgi:hypothetical protein
VPPIRSRAQLFVHEVADRDHLGSPRNRPEEPRLRAVDRQTGAFEPPERARCRPIGRSVRSGPTRSRKRVATSMSYACRRTSRRVAPAAPGARARARPPPTVARNVDGRLRRSLVVAPRRPPPEHRDDGPGGSTTRSNVPPAHEVNDRSPADRRRFEGGSGRPVPRGEPLVGRVTSNSRDHSIIVE